MKKRSHYFINKNNDLAKNFLAFYPKNTKIPRKTAHRKYIKKTQGKKNNKNAITPTKNFIYDDAKVVNDVLNTNPAKRLRVIKSFRVFSTNMQRKQKQRYLKLKFKKYFVRKKLRLRLKHYERIIHKEHRVTRIMRKRLKNKFRKQRNRKFKKKAKRL